MSEKYEIPHFKLLQTQQTIEFGQPVWKVVFNSNGQKIGVCTRDVAHSNYYLLDAATLEVLGSISAPDLGGIEVMNGLVDEDMVFDVFPDMTDPSSFQRLRLNLASGEFEIYSDSQDLKSNLDIPNRYLEGSDHFKSVARFIENQISQKVVSAIDYLETGDLMIVSYYLYESKGMNLVLSIFDLEGQILFEEILDRNLQAIGTESFSLSEESLYFVQNRSNLIKIRLK